MHSIRSTFPSYGTQLVPGVSRQRTAPLLKAKLTAPNLDQTFGAQGRKTENVRFKFFRRGGIIGGILGLLAGTFAVPHLPGPNPFNQKVFVNQEHLPGLYLVNSPGDNYAVVNDRFLLKLTKAFEANNPLENITVYNQDWSEQALPSAASSSTISIEPELKNGIIDTLRVTERIGEEEKTYNILLDIRQSNILRAEHGEVSADRIEGWMESIANHMNWDLREEGGTPPDKRFAPQRTR